MTSMFAWNKMIYYVTCIHLKLKQIIGVIVMSAFLFFVFNLNNYPP